MYSTNGAHNQRLILIGFTLIFISVATDEFITFIYENKKNVSRYKLEQLEKGDKFVWSMSERPRMYDTGQGS